MPATKKRTTTGTALKETVEKFEVKTQRAAEKAQNRTLRAALYILRVEKAAFDRAGKAVLYIQERIEKSFLNLVNKTGWVPKEGEDVLHEWVGMMRRSRNDFTRTIDRTFDLVHKYLQRAKSHPSEINGRTRNRTKTRKPRRSVAASAAR